MSPGRTTRPSIDWFGEFCPPIIGLDPTSALAISIIGDVEGSADPIQIDALQCLYVDQLPAPMSGLGVTTARRHRHTRILTPPNWFVNFASRFAPDMIVHRLATRRREAFGREEFSVTRRKTTFLGDQVHVDCHRHDSLPFEVAGFLHLEAADRVVVVGGWRSPVLSMIPALRSLDKHQAAAFLPFAPDLDDG